MNKLEKFFKSIVRNKNGQILDCFSSAEDAFGSFGGEYDPKSHVVVFANYTQPDYEGYASLIFYDRKAKKFYENYGSHCSCYGLEDQWAPEEIVFEEFEKRMQAGYLSYGLDELQRSYAVWLEGQKK